MRLQLKVFTLILSLASGAVYAATYSPSHSCRKPIKPYKFTSNWEVEQFKDDVARYKQCINDFVDEQNEAVENHKRAAKNAIDEWNGYVRYELK